MDDHAALVIWRILWMHYTVVASHRLCEWIIPRSSDGFCGCIVLWSPVTGFVDGSYRDHLAGFVAASYCGRQSQVLWVDHTVIV
jgi:hypothetical protein